MVLPAQPTASSREEIPRSLGNTPSARWNDCVRQVSWLPGPRSQSAFPDLHPVAFGGTSSPVTVAGAAPDYGDSHFRVPFSSHLWEPVAKRFLSARSMKGKHEE